MYISNGSYHTLRLLVCLLLFLLFEIIYQCNMMIPIFFIKIYTFLHLLFVNGVRVPLDNGLLIWRQYPYRCVVVELDLWSALTRKLIRMSK